MRAWVLAAALAAIGGTAQAEVVDAQAHGFQVRQTLDVAAKPGEVWKALVTPSAWWAPDHTWSGDAKNLKIEARPGGCFCERWKDGGAQHMRVVYVRPGDELRLWGALGPLSMQGMVGGMVVKLAPRGEGTTLTLTYTVGGYAPGGLEKWAPLVDGVLKLQTERLDRYAETGKP